VTLDRYSRRIPSMSRYAAERIDEAFYESLLLTG
jgi:hypothetical protein